MNDQIPCRSGVKNGLVELFHKQMFLSDISTTGPTMARFPSNFIVTFVNKFRTLYSRKQGVDYQNVTTWQTHKSHSEDTEQQDLH